jgi:3-methylcrotonyl-CoA carboxylase alpha subunit
MKMEHSICAPSDGTVTEFYFAAGDLVTGGAQLLSFKTADE